MRFVSDLICRFFHRGFDYVYHRSKEGCRASFKCHECGRKWEESC